ncbi:hypothetical protein ABT173_25585 [Streptomyces sp. NPDC001795]|uniref:hypothetical protein n=1 Tax=Streptomyces sp. NPDC001795 TaxID=3154525 RepID=UPI00331AC65D
MPERILLVDMGGVFFSYSFEQALDHWAAAAGADPARLKAAWKIDEPFDAFERGEITPDAYLSHLRGLLGVDLTDHQLAAGWCAIYGPVNSGLVDLLQKPAIRSRFAAVVGVSNTNELHARVWPELYGEQLPVLDEVVCSYTIGTTKPRVEFFDHVAERHQTPRDRMVLVDDIPLVTATATELGLTAHTYTSTGELAAFLTAV